MNKQTKFEVVISKYNPDGNTYNVSLYAHWKNGHSSSFSRAVNVSYKEAIKIAKKQSIAYFAPIRNNFVEGAA